MDVIVWNDANPGKRENVVSLHFPRSTSWIMRALFRVLEILVPETLVIFSIAFPSCFDQERSTSRIIRGCRKSLFLNRHPCSRFTITGETTFFSRYSNYINDDDDFEDYANEPCTFTLFIDHGD